VFFKHYFRKGKDLEPDPDSLLWLVEPDPDPGGPKTCGSGSPTLTSTFSLFLSDNERVSFSIEFDGSLLMKNVGLTIRYFFPFQNVGPFNEEGSENPAEASRQFPQVRHFFSFFLSKENNLESFSLA
jgi:hypothetical protein